MVKTLVNSGERLGNLLPTLADQPRPDASVWLAHSRKISSPPLVSGNIETAAVVRARPRRFASTLLVPQSTLVLSSFVRMGGPREIQSTRENWRTTVTSQSIRFGSRRTEHDAIRPAAHLHD